MPPAKNKSREQQPLNVADGVQTKLERLALFLLLILIPIRTTINETHTFEVPRLFREIEATQAHAGYTLLFSFLIFGIAVWRAIACLPRDRRAWLPTGGEAGFALLVLALLISTSLAGQKHLALTGGLNLLGVIAYGFTLRSLLNSPARVRLACYVLVGTGLMLAVKGCIQQFIEHPNTLAYFEANKEQLLKNSLYSEGMLHDYEQRLRSAELSGYYPHSNVYGSHLILVLLAALAPVMDRLHRRTPRLTLIAPLAVFGMLAAIVFLATGKGPIIGASVGLGVIVFGALGRRWLTRWRYLALIAAWVCAVFGIIGVGAILRDDPTALGRSLQFRYMYWQGAADMVANRGWGGVGPSNFGRHFTRYKPVECPEEVEAPHSWIVRLLTEWGILGLVGFIALLIGFSGRIAQLVNPRVQDTSAETEAVAKRTNAEQQHAHLQSPNVIRWGLALAAALNLILTQQYATNAYLLLVFLGLGLVLPFLLGILLTAIETRDESIISDAPLGAVALPMFAGAIGFLVHTAIDLALFEGGPATTCFAMIATGFAALGLNHPRQAAPDPRESIPKARGRLASAAGLSLVVVGIAFFIICDRYQTVLVEARRHPVATRIWRHYMKQRQAVAYQTANRAYPLDSTSLGEWVEQLIPRARTPAQFQVALDAAAAFARRDPYNAMRHNLQGTLMRRRYEVSEDIDDLITAAREYELYLATYPTHPDRHIYLADVLVQLADASQQPELRQRAASHLRHALELESKRIYVSEPNRKEPEDIRQIQETIRRLKAFDTTPDATGD